MQNYPEIEYFDGLDALEMGWRTISSVVAPNLIWI